jgi:Fe-S cluster assembly iron-binding protein IscA
MISVTEKAEQKLHSLLKGKEPANLRIICGPDQRLRLILDKGLREPGRENVAIQKILIQDETSSLPKDTVIDISGQDLVFNKASRQNLGNGTGVPCASV